MVPQIGMLLPGFHGDLNNFTQTLTSRWDWTRIQHQSFWWPELLYLVMDPASAKYSPSLRHSRPGDGEKGSSWASVLMLTWTQLLAFICVHWLCSSADNVFNFISFKSSFRFTVKLRRRYRDFQHASCPHPCPAFPVVSIPYQHGTYIASNWTYIDIWSPEVHSLR